MATTLLDFGYLLLHLPDYKSLKCIPRAPYMLSLHCIRDLIREKVANFFRSSLILEVNERLRLLERATDCFSKFNSEFSLAVLEDIEVEAINKSRDRLMKKIKIGREGWVEEGRQEGIEEVALRMLEKDMSVEEICSITKLSHSAVNRLEQESRKALSGAKKRPDLVGSPDLFLLLKTVVP